MTGDGPAADPRDAAPTDFPLGALAPPPTGGLLAEWWEGTARRELLVQRCRSCGTAQHYPRAVCTTCKATDVVFEVASGAASLYSFTTVWRAPHAGLQVPYVVALVRLAEGPLLLSRVEGAEEPSLSCDEPLRLDWAPLGDGRALPIFVPDRSNPDEP